MNPAVACITSLIPMTTFPGEEYYALDSDEEAGAQRHLINHSRSYHLTNRWSRFQHALPFTAHWDLSSRKSRRPFGNYLYPQTPFPLIFPHCRPASSSTEKPRPPSRIW